KTSTATNTAGNMNCTLVTVPWGMVLAHKSKEWWCRWECGYCIGNDPNYVCFIGDEEYPEKEHFYTTGGLSGYEHLGFPVMNCDAFSPGEDTISEPCE